MPKSTFKYLLKIFTKKFPKVLYFPLFMLIPLFFLCALGINGSSIGTFNEALYGNAGDNKIFGENQWIRSDEYLAVTPVVLSAVKNGLPEINKNIGTGIDLGIQSNMPTGNLFSIFKPPTWLFYLQTNIDIGFAFFWWFRAYLLIVGTYLLIYELTKGDFTVSIIGGFIFFFTPFVQWWSNYEPIAYAPIIVYSFIKLLSTKSLIISLILASLFYLFSVSFVLILYPPFQIVVMWTSVAIATGYILSDITKIKSNNKLRRNIILISTVLLLIIATVISFYIRYKSSISTIMNTAYPGKRFYSGGSFKVQQMFNGFYNILLQSSDNGIPIGQHNQSEASSFLLYLLPLTIYIPFNFFRNKNKKDIFPIVLNMWLIFLVLWSTIPFPAIVAKITLLSLVPPFRSIIGIGFGSYILTFYVISKKRHESEKFFLPVILSIAWSIVIFILGIKFYTGNPNFFTKPQTLTPEMKLALVLTFTFISTYLLLRKHKLLFMTSVLLYSIASTSWINPLHKGVNAIDRTPISKILNKYPSDSNHKWVAYGDHRFAQYLTGNGQAVLNGIHYYPLFEMWEIIDPHKEFYNIYNRYAHIHFSDNEKQYGKIELIYADQIKVNISPCDTKLDALKVKYYLLPDKKEYSCLEYLESFHTLLRGDMHIYKRH